MLDHRKLNCPAQKLRDHGKSETPDGDLIQSAIVRQIALCGRHGRCVERLAVKDEIETALAHMREVFLPALPALYSRWETVLPHRPQSFLRLGSWLAATVTAIPMSRRRRSIRCGGRARPCS